MGLNLQRDCNLHADLSSLAMFLSHTHTRLTKSHSVSAKACVGFMVLVCPGAGHVEKGSLGQGKRGEDLEIRGLGGSRC